MEQLELIFLLLGMQDGTATWENRLVIINSPIPSFPIQPSSITHSETFLRETDTCVHIETCPQISIATLFKMPQNWEWSEHSWSAARIHDVCSSPICDLVHLPPNHKKAHRLTHSIWMHLVKSQASLLMSEQWVQPHYIPATLTLQLGNLLSTPLCMFSWC